MLATGVYNKPLWGLQELAIKGRKHLTTGDNVKRKLVEGAAGAEIRLGTSTGQ